MHQQLRECDREIERLLTAIDKEVDANQRPPPPRTKPPQPTRKNQHQFASWPGVSPNAKSSGGKMKSSQTRKVTSRAARIFRMAAKSASRSKTYIGAFYRRMKARLGAPTYSPHLNRIEILWRFIKYSWLDFSAYAGWKSLVKQVEEILRTVGTKYCINFV